MKPSLYSKIRPASEIKQVNTEFKVARDEIVSRVTKSEYNSEAVVWEQVVEVNTATPKVIKDKAGNDLEPNHRYGYKVEGRVSPTGTNTGAIVYFLPATASGTPTFEMKVLKENGQSSNHVRFFIDANGKPSVGLYSHSSMYTVYMTITKIAGSLAEGAELGARVTSAENKITADAITSTVTSHQTYKNDVMKKVNDKMNMVDIAGRNLVVLRTSTEGEFITHTGALSSNAEWAYTDYIPVYEGEQYIASGYMNLGNGPSTAFYNENKALISSIQNGSITSGTPTEATMALDQRRIVTAPVNARYMRFSFQVSDKKTIKVERGNVATAWNAAPEDVSNLISETKSSILEQTDDSITLAVKSTKEYIQSRGENLVTNGTGLLGDNTNFTTSTFDKSDAYASNGSFTFTGEWDGPESAELMPVNPDNTYRFKYYTKANPLVGTPRIYGYVASYDADGESIQPYHTMYRANTLTTLKTTLSPGATTVSLTSSANWYNAGNADDSYNRSFIFWNFVNKGGYAWPENTYSRNYHSNMWNAGGINTSTHVITLRVPWAGPTIPAGTKVSNGSSGGALKYIAGAYSQIDGTWKPFEGTMGGIDTSGQNLYNKFHPGTAAVKIGWLCNITGVGSKTWISNISFNIDYQGQIDGLDTRVEETESQITQTSDKISLVVKEVNGENKVDGNALVSAINVQPSEIKIASKNINIEGAVTFSSLDANVLSTISEEPSLLNINPTFSRWTSTYPEGYVLSSGSAPSKVASDNGKPNAVQYVVAAGSSQYIHQDITGMGVHQYVTLEATFKLVSGALGGSGIMMRYMNSSNGAIQDCLMSFKSIVTSPILGRWYTVSKTFKASTLTNVDRYRLYVMAGWTSFGAIETKTIQFDSVRFRPALEPEVIAYETGAKVEGWTMPGKTTINGGNIETNTIDVNRLKAGTISADTINISSASSGVTFNASGITATRGSIVVSMNSGSGFKITNSGTDVFRVESDGMIYAKGLTTLSEFNNLQIGGRNLLVTRDAIENTWLGLDGEQASAVNNDLMRAKIAVTAGESLYFTKNTTGSDNFWRWNYYNTSGAYVGRVPNESNAFAWIVPADIASIWVSYPRNSKPKIERGTRPTDWTPAPEDVDSQIVDIYNKITTVEEKITAESITSTVLNAVEFNDNIQAAVSGKVNIEDLDAYTTLASLEETKRQLQDYADGKISAIDLSSYVSTSQLTQTQNDFNFKLTSAGGVNLLQNSVGWAGDYNWTLGGTGGSGEYQVIKGTSELVGLGAGAAWKLNTRSITQDVPVVAGETYSFQMLVKKTASDAGGYIDIDEGDGNLAQKHVYLSASAYNWTPFNHTFVAKSGNIRIRIRNVGTGNTLITNVMLNKGPLPMQWTHAKNEIHNTNVRFDLGGIVVQNDATNGETRITPTEFAGYARDDAGVQEKIFTLNGDTTEVKKLKASEEFAMGPLRILQIESGSVNGWAFLPRD